MPQGKRSSSRSKDCGSTCRRSSSPRRLSLPGRVRNVPRSASGEAPPSASQWPMTASSRHCRLRYLVVGQIERRAARLFERQAAKQLWRTSACSGARLSPVARKCKMPSARSGRSSAPSDATPSLSNSAGRNGCSSTTPAHVDENAFVEIELRRRGAGRLAGAPPRASPRPRAAVAPPPGRLTAAASKS